MYSSSTVATLTISGITNVTGTGLTGLSIGGNAFVSVEETFTDGSASTSRTGDSSVIDADPPGLRIDDGLSQNAQVSGSAEPGISFAAHVNDGLISLSNQSSDIFEIDFLLDFALTSTASADDPLFELAFASAYVGIWFDNDALHESFFVLAGTIETPPEDGLEGLQSYTVVLDSGESDTVSMSSWADGIAVSEVTIPEPATLMLLAVGLLAAGAASVSGRPLRS
jgi:hypothetical protein